jgi:transcriptional regulator with XRE-family HTH domain
MRLRLRRRQIGMSQVQVAKALDLTFQQIQKYEYGTNRLGASRLHQLSCLLDVPIVWFFEGLPGLILSDPQPYCNKGASPGKVLSMSIANIELLPLQEALSLIHAYSGILNPKKRHKVFQLVKSMAQNKESAAMQAVLNEPPTVTSAQNEA